MNTVVPANCQISCSSKMSEIVFAQIHLHSIYHRLTLYNIHANIHCDGLSAISSINKASQTSSCTKSNYGIINLINAHCPLLSFMFYFQHIKEQQTFLQSTPIQ